MKFIKHNILKLFIVLITVVTMFFVFNYIQNRNKEEEQKFINMPRIYHLEEIDNKVISQKKSMGYRARGYYVKLDNNIEYYVNSRQGELLKHGTLIIKLKSEKTVKLINTDTVLNIEFEKLD